MYGTIARVKVKAGMENQFAQCCADIGVGKSAGQITAYAYQMDSDSREFFLVAVFESREAFRANANSPEQHQKFMRLMELLDAEPEWHDGEIVYHGEP